MPPPNGVPARSSGQARCWVMQQAGTNGGAAGAATGSKEAEVVQLRGEVARLKQRVAELERQLEQQQ